MPFAAPPPWARIIQWPARLAVMVFACATLNSFPMDQQIMQDAKEMRSYWDDKITWWADSSYEEKPRGAVQRFMARLRRSVHARAVISLELLRPIIAGKTVLDVGCGNGHFLKGCLEAGAARAIGIDIAPQAVDLAAELARRNGYADRSEFHVGRAKDPLPPSDIVTGFGLIDWLSREECMAFFRQLKGRKFVFSFSEMDGSFDEWVHYFYLIERLRYFGGGVRAFHHPRSVILNRLAKAGITDVEVVVRREMRFGRLVHNLD
jgi:SAM-dependent methyltransferase